MFDDYKSFFPGVTKVSMCWRGRDQSCVPLGGGWPWLLKTCRGGHNLYCYRCSSHSVRVWGTLFDFFNLFIPLRHPYIFAFSVYMHVFVFRKRLVFMNQNRACPSMRYRTFLISRESLKRFPGCQLQNTANMLLWLYTLPLSRVTYYTLNGNDGPCPSWD